MVQPARTPQPRRTPPNTKLVMVAAAIGALLILTISLLLNWPMESGKVGGPAGVGEAPAPKVVFETSPGECLNWTEPDAADIRKVTCAEPHLFEVTGPYDLREFGPNAPFPTTEQWQDLKQQRCIEVSDKYLGDRFDKEGRFTVGAFTPSQEGWVDGDRTLHCGLQQPGPSGKLFPISGEAGKMDQSNVYPAGRCLGINGTQVWDPVDCARPHSVELSAVINLADQFQGNFPPENDQDGFLAGKCEELTAAYAGGPTAAKDKGLVVYWDTLSEESWAAGSRQVNCKLSAQLQDGSGLAPVTGSVKGEVQVGNAPAGRNPTSTEPGAPATEQPR